MLRFCIRCGKTEEEIKNKNLYCAYNEKVFSNGNYKNQIKIKNKHIYNTNIL